jgi:hypothetical protein
VRSLTTSMPISRGPTPRSVAPADPGPTASWLVASAPASLTRLVTAARSAGATAAPDAL